MKYDIKESTLKARSELINEAGGHPLHESHLPLGLEPLHRRACLLGLLPLRRVVVGQLAVTVAVRVLAGGAGAGAGLVGDEAVARRRSQSSVTRPRS